MVANPTDLVKIRLQSQGKPSEGVSKKYRGVIHAYSKIISTEGTAALWNGVGPNIFKSGVVNGTELALYDQMK